MKLYFEILKLLSKKYIKKIDTGSVIKDFCLEMGTVYIKLGQILATQNFGNIFSEEDRKSLSTICDNCKSIEFNEIKKIIESEYGCSIEDKFVSIEKVPVGAASISQVHKGILKNGKEVAIKIKRKDITDGIEKDIKKIRKLVHRFGRIVGVNNITGGDKGLDLYLNWIKEETDFNHEKQNIIDYNNFASSVNGKVRNAKRIRVPKVYNELCTENIIVMDFIDCKTINQLNLHDENNKKKISEALNSYLQLSFYALFNNKKIIFHGDPHSANIYIDKEGNIGFLDMGLIFEMSEEDSRLTREFFLSAYSNNHKKLQDLLIPFGNFDEETKEKFRNDVSECCNKIQNMPVTSYFTEFIAVAAKYDMVPPEFLFNMAKTFICLNGINIFTNNLTKATELLKEQAVEFYINRTINDSTNLAVKGLKIISKLTSDTLQYGLAKGISMGSSEIAEIQPDLKETLTNYKEVLRFFVPPDNANNEKPYQATLKPKS